MALVDSSAAPTLRGKVSTGYSRLDEALKGGFLAGSAILLTAPASSEVPLLVRNFLKASEQASLLICRSQSSAEGICEVGDTYLKCLICSEKPIPLSKNLLPGKSIDNLTELNFQITETLGSVQPKRIAIEILSDILLRHKALQTRKWLNEFMEKLRSKNITTLAVLNPYMHATEEVQAVVDLFDGNLELVEKEVEGHLEKFLRIRWMHGVEPTEKELPVLDLSPQMPEPFKQQTVIAFKEPKWLTALVGRTAELSKMKLAFENALKGSSSVVALQGETGVGKTRLMQELAVYAQAQKAIVLSGSGLEEKLPYAPWIEATRQLVAQAPAELLRRVLGPNKSEIVKLVPDIAAKLGTIPPSKDFGEVQDKIRFYEAVTQFFLAISKDAPLVLLFDDMKFADQSTLDLLEYFVRRSVNPQVLIVCSIPSEHELESGSPLEQALLKLNKQRIIELVQVKNLNQEETTSLIRQVFGEQTVSSEFADQIYQRTAGNPFFIEEILRSLVEDGTIFRTERGWDRKPIQEIVIPKSVKTTLRSRLVKLDQEALNVLQWAALAGSEFDFDILLLASEVKEDALFKTLERATSQALLVEVPGEKSEFRFVDNRIRQLLLEDMIHVKQTRFHLKIAEAMEKHYAINLESQAESIANHFSEGGDAERTLKYSIMAGDRNLAVYAYDQAIRNFKGALTVLESETGRDEEKAKVLEKLGMAHDSAGHAQYSIQYYEQALEMFEKLHDLKACARICVGLSYSLFRSKPTGAQDAVLMLKHNLKYVEGTPESYEAAAFYSQLASRLSATDQVDESKAWAQRAQLAGEKSNNFEAVGMALGMKAEALLVHDQIDEGLSLLEKSYELALQHEQYGGDGGAGSLLLALSGFTTWRNLTKARELALRGLELDQRYIRTPTNETAHIEWICFLDWLSGDWRAALDGNNRVLETANRLGFTNDYILFAELNRGSFLVGIGDLDQAEKYLEGSAKQRSEVAFLVLYNHYLGDLRFEQGRVDDAKAHYEKCVAIIKDRHWTWFITWFLTVETLMHLTAIYAMCGQLDKARSTHEWAKRVAEPWRSDGLLAMISQAEAHLLRSTGDAKGSEDAYLKSLDLWEKAGWPYYHAKALVAYADAIAQKNPEESRRRLVQASEIFRKLGAKRDLEKAEAKLSVK